MASRMTLKGNLAKACNLFKQPVNSKKAQWPAAHVMMIDTAACKCCCSLHNSERAWYYRYVDFCDCTGTLFSMANYMNNYIPGKMSCICLNKPTLYILTLSGHFPKLNFVRTCGSLPTCNLKAKLLALSSQLCTQLCICFVKCTTSVCRICGREQELSTLHLCILLWW